EKEGSAKGFVDPLSFVIRDNWWQLVEVANQHHLNPAKRQARPRAKSFKGGGQCVEEICTNHRNFIYDEGLEGTENLGEPRRIVLGAPNEFCGYSDWKRKEPVDCVPVDVQCRDACGRNFDDASMTHLRELSDKRRLASVGFSGVK